MTARSKSITKDELFIFDPSHSQISLFAHNGKIVSIKQGIYSAWFLLCCKL